MLPPLETFRWLLECFQWWETCCHIPKEFPGKELLTMFVMQMGLHNWAFRIYFFGEKK
jgi:hypothetical protein